MKTIVEHGYNTYQTRCNTCHCLFKYELEDINLNWLICPECGAKCWHTVNDKIPTSQIEENNE